MSSSIQEKARGNGQVTTGQNQERREPTTARPQRQSYDIEPLRPRLAEYLTNIGIELRRNGSRLTARCPVHEDRSPSFAVFGTKHETCGCHPCDFTGDIFATSQWLGRSSTFPEAVKDVAAVLGVSIDTAPSKPITTLPRREKPPEPPFVLSDSDSDKVHAARLAFSDAFHAGDEIIDRIAASLGLDRETLRFASWGASGLGLASGGYRYPATWLCYAYPQGLKWRNPDTEAKAKGLDRFLWPVGKATVPWRWEWVKPSTRTIYLTEGESDCMALLAAGLEADGTAACVANPGTSFPREWAQLFQGKRVVLCFDLDQPGRDATANVAAILKGHAAEILTWKGTARHA